MTIQNPTVGQYTLVDASDPEWVADLLDTLREGDVDAAISGLEELMAPLRRAVKARRILATLEPKLIRRGLEVSASRRR